MAVAPPRRHPDPRCEPRIEPALAAATLAQANALIKAHGDHVSTGELAVILPLLRLAAHSGDPRAQQRYGYYVVGYWATDEMFWPRQQDVAVDALAMLHHAARTTPELFGDDERASLLEFKLGSTPSGMVLPAAWVKAAKAAEAEFERCQQQSP